MGAGILQPFLSGLRMQDGRHRVRPGRFDRQQKGSVKAMSTVLVDILIDIGICLLGGALGFLTASLLIAGEESEDVSFESEDDI